MILLRNKKGLQTPDKGEVYGSTISHVADLYGIIGSDIPLADECTIVDDDHARVISVKGTPMGVSVPITKDGYYRSVDRKLLKKMKFRKDQRFKAQMNNGWYILEDGKNLYGFYPSDCKVFPSKKVEVTSKDYRFGMDTAELRKMFDAERKRTKKGDSPPVVCFRQDGSLVYGVMNGNTDGKEFDQGPVVIARSGYPGRRSTFFRGDYISDISDVTDDADVSVMIGGPSGFEWKGPNYKASYFVAPLLNDEWREKDG